ncbi:MULTISPECIES: P-loop ATPase, Sll1717 family [unclassified Thioalkalivibrio]|uniref:P-loop ATPase, Sll1717 family n=1 Tax=unclassified Thioalkalivibrio TaxID=2621013 RepID=UPI0003A7D1D1|nr:MULTISPECIES: hypothetical protein [unclassified Thioalkalivibrio]
MNQVKFPLSEPDHLFGNEAAEDEPYDILESYAVKRPEIKRFLDPNRSVQVIRAYKGEGKSALLRLVEGSLSEQNPRPLVIRSTAQALSPSLDSDDSDDWVRSWKANIFRQIASEIGGRLNLAFSDDAMSLVEEAERNGFKSRSLVSSIVDRLQSKAVPLERTRPPLGNAEALLKRWLANGAPVWLILDDIDQNYQNTSKQKMKVASCFIAVRQIFAQVPEVRARLCVRPNVWASIKSDFEALSHVEQYMVDLSWDNDRAFEDILARRVEGFLKRTDQWSEVVKTLSPSLAHRNTQLVNLLFESPVAWGGRGKKRPIHVVLHTLSRHRPRWLVELCKLASIEADRQRNTQITLDDITKQLDEFGRRRIGDTVAEFRAQCPQIENLIIAFADQPERFTTDQLLRALRDRVLQGVDPKIEGVIGKPGAREVAHFLFQIGFLSARRDEPDGSYEHLTYAARPNLLRATTNLDEGVSWEIHPVFRQTLRLKDVESKSERARSDRNGR